LGVVLAGLVLAPMYMALRWWIAHHYGLRRPGPKRPLEARFWTSGSFIFRNGIRASARAIRSL